MQKETTNEGVKKKQQLLFDTASVVNARLNVEQRAHGPFTKRLLNG
jgi:hypothetical protein